tara:strand:+ start:1178 stop:2059 length:882 start_codon:yes stop_codon:yes gene_type:complete
MLDKLFQLKKLYSNNTNILDFLREEKQTNRVEDILISYDLQSGTYTQNFEENPYYYINYTKELSIKIKSLGGFKTIMEVGVGEATVLVNLLKHLNMNNIKPYGFDLSWSRLRYAKQFSEKHNYKINLFAGDLFSIPVADESIDIVYSSHSIEPNGGREEEALKELYRITRHYLILLEPDFERGSVKAKKRMISNGYITKLNETIKKLNYNILLDEPFRGSSNVLNPTGIKIIKKESNNSSKSFRFICPNTKQPISKVRNVYANNKVGLIYPIIDRIPCLLSSNAILATHFNQF